MRNILLNYETTNKNIKRKDYINKSLIFLAKTLQNHKYNWLIVIVKIGKKL